jgi:hypothetical protein
MKMIRLSDADYSDILVFPLIWRWNSKNHAEFPPEQLHAIRPLTAEAAEKIHESLKHLHRPEGLNRSAIHELRKIQAEENEEAINAWIDDLPIADEEVILLSWSSELAVQTQWKILKKSWSDFWYPASDDLTATPISVSWVLAVSHSGLFEWAKTAGR